MAGKVIEVPGVGVVEFPQEMGDDEIIAEIGKMSTASPSSAPDPLHTQEGFAHGGVDAIFGGQKAVAVGTALTNALIKAVSKNPAYQRLSTDPTEQLAYERQKLARSEQEQPGNTLLGRVAGGAAGYAAAGAYVPAKLVQALGAAPAGALTYGALRGGANADRLSEMVPRAATEGMANASAVAGLGNLTSALGSKATEEVAAAQAAGAAKTSKTVEETIGKLRGALGGRTANGSRIIDILQRELQDASPERQAEILDTLRTPEMAKLREAIYQNTKDAAPRALSEIQSARQAFEAADPEQLYADEYARQMGKGSALREAMVRAKRYVPSMLAGAALGHQVGGMPGAALGLSFRPAVQAGMRLLTKYPSVQESVWGGIGSLAKLPAALAPETVPTAVQLSGDELAPLLEAYAKNPDQTKQDALADAIRWRKE